MDCTTNNKTVSKGIKLWIFRALVIQKHGSLTEKGEVAKHDELAHQQFSSESKGKTVFYRTFFEKLLSFPKPLRDAVKEADEENLVKSECTRSDSCPLAMEGCHCKMFTPTIEVKTDA